MIKLCYIFLRNNKIFYKKCASKYSNKLIVQKSVRYLDRLCIVYVQQARNNCSLRVLSVNRKKNQLEISNNNFSKMNCIIKTNVCN